MKKIFLLTIALCMAAALAACGAETGEAASQNSETVSVTQSETDSGEEKTFSRTEQISQILTFRPLKKATFPKKLQVRF